MEALGLRNIVWKKCDSLYSLGRLKTHINKHYFVFCWFLAQVT